MLKEKKKTNVAANDMMRNAEIQNKIKEGKLSYRQTAVKYDLKKTRLLHINNKAVIVTPFEEECFTNSRK